MNNNTIVNKSSTNTVDMKDDVKKLAKKIEALACQVESSVDSTDKLLPLTSEMVRTCMTLIFTVGEVSGAEFEAKKQKSNITVNIVSNPNKTKVNSQKVYVRNALGQFAKV